MTTAFSAMRIIVTIGWAIYPLGYVFGYLTGDRCECIEHNLQFS